MIIRRPVIGYSDFGAGPAGTIAVTAADGSVSYKTGAEIAALMMQARQTGTLVATRAPDPATTLMHPIETLVDPGSDYVPSVLTDTSGKLDPTRLAIFGLGAVGLLAGIFMLKTK